MYSYNEKDTVGKLVSNFWKISRVLRDTYDGRGSQRRVLTVLLKSGDVITQSVLTERLDIQPGSASEVLAKLEAAGLIQRTAHACPASGTQIPAPCRRTERPVPP